MTLTFQSNDTLIPTKVALELGYALASDSLIQILRFLFFFSLYFVLTECIEQGGGADDADSSVQWAGYAEPGYTDASSLPLTSPPSSRCVFIVVCCMCSYVWCEVRGAVGGLFRGRLADAATSSLPLTP